MTYEQQSPRTAGNKTSRDSMPAPGGAGLLRRGLSSESAAPAQDTLPPNAPEEAEQPKTEPDGPRQTTKLGGRAWRSQSSASHSRPLSRPSGRGRLPRFLITALVVGTIWFLAAHFAQPSGLPVANQPTPGTTRQATAPAAGTASPATTPTGPANSAPDQVAAQFLSDYFSWKSSEDTAAYTQQWAGAVASASLATLEQAPPRTTLDNGDDVAAQSPLPTIPSNAVTLQQQNAQIDATWGIQVMSAGRSSASWQSRRLEATVLLTLGGSGWQVTNVYWTVGSI